MSPFDEHYVHGTAPEERQRLAKLNDLLNDSSLEALALHGGERVLDLGSGLGQFTRLMARESGGQVIGIERDAEQLADARQRAAEAGQEGLVEFRRGDVADLPLSRDEWGSFDVVHTRFLLEHVTDPLQVVRTMVRAARPGGRIVLEDDDHDVLRLSPDVPDLLELWRAYYTTYEKRGKDPAVGRHLVSLLYSAGCLPRQNRCLFFGSCAGHPTFEAMIENFVGVIQGAKDEMLAAGLADMTRFDAGLEAFRVWSARPDAALWYTTSWAEGTTPSAAT